jgi:hypothetical protein
VEIAPVRSYVVRMRVTEILRPIPGMRRDNRSDNLGSEIASSLLSRDESKGA